MDWEHVFKSLGRFIHKTVKDVIKHTDNEVVWCGVALGYPNDNDPINQYRTSREDINKFVSFLK